MKPLFRRGQTWDSPHERARTRAGERLWEVLDAGESEWLDRHLAECRDCRAVADSYEAQRLELRGLRDRQPVPPRDLWARTAAAIEREDARRRPSLRPDRAARTPILRRKRPSPIPLGAISGLLVVAVVVGVSLLGGRTPSVNIPTSPQVALTQQPRSLSPGSTPIAVTAGPVGWLRYGPEGQIDVFFSPIDEVCADSTGPACAPIEEPTPRTGDLPDVPPQTVVMSPKEEQLVVVQAPGGSGTGKVMVVPVPTAPGSSPDPTPGPVITETPTPPVTETPAPPVTETPTPPVVETPIPPIAETPTPPVTETPTPVVETPTPVVETPTPTPVGPQEIASDVIVVGQSAGYSSDGVWFAFSAKPTDGSHGPDIYLWRVGDPKATPITTDHHSVFSGWLLDGRLLASRPALEPVDATASPSPAADVRPESFLIDPETGAQTVLDAAPFWRPSVGPSGLSAIYWDGVLTLADNGFEWRAGTGQLVLGAWPPVPGPAAEPQASEAPASEEPAASPEASAPALLQVIDARAIRDWDARWDETGSHVAIWIADEADPTIGFLSLYVVDPETGKLDLDNPLMASQALPGFSIGSGRIAWATPPGQDGNGSHVEVVAWTKDASGDDASGKVESAPGEEQVVVIR